MKKYPRKPCTVLTGYEKQVARNFGRETAIREHNATESFVGDIIEQFGFTEEQARRIFTVYRTIKAIKLDRYNGRWNLSHGALWERQPMERALDYETQ